MLSRHGHLVGRSRRERRNPPAHWPPRHASGRRPRRGRPTTAATPPPSRGPREGNVASVRVLPIASSNFHWRRGPGEGAAPSAPHPARTHATPPRPPGRALSPRAPQPACARWWNGPHGGRALPHPRQWGRGGPIGTGIEYWMFHIITPAHSQPRKQCANVQV